MFVSHGPGPLPLVWDREGKHGDLIEGFKNITTQLNIKKKDIRAIVVVSAHYETKGEIEVTSQTKHPSLLYDYGGFPEWTYELTYSPGGSPSVAKRVVELVNERSTMSCKENVERNLDHGVFVPLMFMFPKANVPVLQVSIPALTRDRAYNAKLCYDIGDALEPLRSEGVLLVCSGQLTHGQGRPEGFVKSILEILLKDSIDDSMRRKLLQWEHIPESRQAHRREEHLLPLHVAVGASKNNEKISLLSSGWWGNLCMAHLSIGNE